VKFLCKLAARLILVLLAFTVSYANASGPLYFGIQGAAGKRTLESIWHPLLSDLGQVLGREVIPRQFDDYAGTVEAFKKGEIQLAWLGNKNAINAVDQAGAEIFAQVLNARGVPGYYSLIIARSDRGFGDFDDVWGARRELIFGFGDPNSTSGTTVPLYFLFAEPNRDVGEFKSLQHGNHEQNFLDVFEGSVDVATISSVMLKRFQERYPEKARMIASIWASPLIPTDPLLWGENLEQPLKDKVLAFFLQYGKAAPGKSEDQVAAEKSRLTVTKWSGFKASSNSQLKYVRLLSSIGEEQSRKIAK
jgi:phosphonate transport system substrate-binding protein